MTPDELPIFCTVTVMVPEGSPDGGVSITCVLVAFILIVAGITASFGPVTAMFVELTLPALAASLKVMVMGVVALTQVAFATGTTELTEIADVTVGAEEFERELLQPLNARDAAQIENETRTSRGYCMEPPERKTESVTPGLGRQ